MKRTRTLAITLLALVVTIVLVGGVVGLAQKYLSAQEAASRSKFATCQVHGASHTVTIKDDKASQANVTGKVCDTLTITNEDNKIRLIAFGPHENHQPYDGITEQVISQGQSVQLVLNQAGTFHWHDHTHDEVEGYFTVQP